MKIQKIKIENFKGIDELEFKPRMINLIIGKNNTGKTSLLEAIDLHIGAGLSNRKEHIASLIKVNSYESVIELTVDGEERVLKLKRPDREKIIIEFKKHMLTNIKNLQKHYPPELFSRLDENDIQELEKILDIVLNQEMIIDEILQESISIIDDGVESVVFSVQLFRNSKIEKFMIEYSKKINEHLSKKNNKMQILPYHFILGEMDFKDIGTERNKCSFIKQLLPLSPLLKETPAERANIIYKIDEIIKKYNLVQNIKKFDTNFLIFEYENGQPSAVPFSFMGDGFKAMVSLLRFMLSEKSVNKIILLEEPEIRMHPAYIRDLINFIIKFSHEMKLQFFITTHNIDFIESFLDDFLPMEAVRYIDNELLILRMEKGGVANHMIPDFFDRKEAIEKKDKLFFDLRGV
jgi:AAA15 family ATPase/GTPase